MKKKIFSFMLAFVCIISCGFALTGCGKKGTDDNSMNIQQNLPDKVHVEYGNVVYVKDGNDIYAKSNVYSLSGRNEVYVRTGLSDGVFYWQGQGQYFISARWDEYNNCWENADNDIYEEGWEANKQNHMVVSEFIIDHGTYKYGPDTTAYMMYGYYNINSSSNLVVATQLADETITLSGSGQRVECVVWEYVFEDESAYEKDKYWFAKDSNIFLKGLCIFDKKGDIDTEGSTYNIPEATYYAVGESMDDFLQKLSPSRTKPDFSAWH
mgnify:CR=1 FL=1